MKIKLIREQKAEVRNWLNSDYCYKQAMCPFEFVGGKICKSYFPKSKCGHMCPCSAYPLSTVIKRAKQMLEEGK